MTPNKYIYAAHEHAPTQHTFYTPLHTYVHSAYMHTHSHMLHCCVRCLFAMTTPPQHGAVPDNTCPLDHSKMGQEGRRERRGRGKEGEEGEGRKEGKGEQRDEGEKKKETEEGEGDEWKKEVRKEVRKEG